MKKSKWGKILEIESVKNATTNLQEATTNNLEKSYKLKAGTGFSILEQRLNNKVTEYISKNGYYLYLDRVITNFSNNIVDDLVVNGVTKYKATDDTLSDTWSSGSTLQNLDLSTALAVTVKSGTTTVKTVTYSDADITLRSVGSRVNIVKDKLTKTGIIRNVGVLTLSEIVAGDVLETTASKIVIKLSGAVIDINNPLFMTQGIGLRGTIYDGLSGVIFSPTHQVLTLTLLKSEMATADLDLTTVNTWLADHQITVLYNKQTPTVEPLSKTFAPFLISGDINVTTDSTLNPIVEVKVKCTREQIKDYLFNKNNVKYNGQLKVIDGTLCNSKDKPVQIKGIGTHLLLQYGHLFNTDTIKTLKYYGVSILRLTAYTASRNYVKSKPKWAEGYLDKPAETRAKMDELIAICKNLNMYCIVDWHVLQDEVILNSVTQAKEFFSYFSTKYPADPAILYEILNEPFDSTTADIASFVAQSAPMITANSPNAVMLCGKKSTDAFGVAYTAIQEAIELPNLMLTQHPYVGVWDTATYTTLFRDNVLKAVYNAKIPYFISEWGNSLATGDGQTSDEVARMLIEDCKKFNFSWCVWKLTDQDMTTSVLQYNQDLSDGYTYGGWVGDDLSHTGKLVFEYFSDDVQNI